MTCLVVYAFNKTVCVESIPWVCVFLLLLYGTDECAAGTLLHNINLEMMILSLVVYVISFFFYGFV